MKTHVTINREQRLYVIPAGKGYTCLGFSVCKDRLSKLRAEMGIPGPIPRAGTRKLYTAYQEAVEQARQLHVSTGWRSKSELTPQLVGLEGHRVEVVEKGGERRRFIVGKSSGWIPCHLEIAKRTSSGGTAVMGAPFESVRDLGRVR